MSCDLTVVERDGVQTGEQLSLVLVDSLHLDVEHGVGIDHQVVVLVQVCRELYFVLLRETDSQGERDDEARRADRHLLNSRDVSGERVIVCVLEDVLQLIEVCQEAITNPLQPHNRQPIRSDFPVLHRRRPE